MRHLIIFLGLLLTAYTTAQARDCESVIVHSKSQLNTLGEHAEAVRECIELASDFARQSYQLAFGLCQKQTLSLKKPVAIRLPNGKIVQPLAPDQETWEQFALRLGLESNESGCRDGILASLLQQRVIDTAFVRGVLERAQLQIPDLLNGIYDVAYDSGFLTLEGKLTVSQSSTNGQVLDTSSVVLGTDAILRFTETPFQLNSRVVGQVKVGAFLTIPLAGDAEARGRISGLINGKDLSIKILNFTIDALTFEATPVDVPDLTSVTQQVGARVDILNQTLTADLRKAYAEIDPFAFLALLKKPQ